MWDDFWVIYLLWASPTVDIPWASPTVDIPWAAPTVDIPWAAPTVGIFRPFRAGLSVAVHFW
jgi:hypothetical protein